MNIAQTKHALSFISISLVFFSSLALAAPPKLNFSDLINGPSTGLNDGKGSGAIVTVWGQYLDNSQGSSQIIFTDSSGKEHSPYIYYWKNADGILPGGPANLYESHKMQEVAFSIPHAENGPGTIRFFVNGALSNTLPFTVRAGTIFHIMQNGSDNTGNGSFTSPWASVGYALDAIDAPGSILYIHDSISTGSANREVAVFWDNPLASSGITNQFGVVAYPNSKPSATGQSGFRNYLTAGQVISKISIYASNCEENVNGNPVNCPIEKSYGIESSAYGRSVGNIITDIAGHCASAWEAGISGNALYGRDRVSSFQALGNEIFEYGCTGSRKFQHTTYLTVRSGDLNLQVKPWRFGWNYLHDNDTKNGIHQYDENNVGNECGSPTGTVVINDNVVINQSGTGIFIGSNCPWSNDFDIYNNIVMNSGRANAWDGIDPNTSNGKATAAMTIKDGGLLGSVFVRHNIFYGWNNDNQDEGTKACLGFHGNKDNVSVYWNNNICYTDTDKPFVTYLTFEGPHLMDNITGSNNAWYYSGASPQKAIPPTWDNNKIVVDPLLSVTNNLMRLDDSSPLISHSATTLKHDVYGTPRPISGTIGAIEYTGPIPNPPVDIQVH